VIKVQKPQDTELTDALLEFVKDDEPRQFLDDAQTLKGWLEDVNLK